ncbi:hypothetical protein CASFOL_020794 [Castilleja foliolosa]|uniref:KIB1-4 beta-propeller domain-containing protein n=1 Tax=Castilleja foliolosa TaxID=1961234 RepID=A0ABD3D3D3_9LAMI
MLHPFSIFRSTSLGRLRCISTNLCSRLFSSSSRSPWLTLPPTFEGDDMIHNFYSLADNKVLSFNKGYIPKGPQYLRGGSHLELPENDSVIIGSSHGYLALLNQHRGDVFLYNPISGWLRKLPCLANLVDNYDLKLRTLKFILSFSPDNHDPLEYFRAIVSFGPGDRLAFCLPGVSYEWTPIGISGDKPIYGAYAYSYRYQDFVYSTMDKLFYAINDLSVHSWDLSERRAPRVEPTRWLRPWCDFSTIRSRDHHLMSIGIDETKDTYPWPYRSEEDNKLKDLCRQLKYLISLSDGRLFLVIRHVVEQMAPDGSPYVEPEDDIHLECYSDSDYEYDKVKVDYPYKTVGFDVHHIVRDEAKWRLTYMEGSLDGMTMFVGSSQSFALSSSEFPELKANAIYFADDKDLSEFHPPGYRTSSSYGGHDVGIFDYENRIISSCYYPCDYNSIRKIEPTPMWFTPTEE